MNNLIFSLNATVPIFLMMLLGLVLRLTGIIDEAFASKMNNFVFKIPLPIMVFGNLASVDFSQVWDLKFVFFCFAATFLSIVIAGLVSALWKDCSFRGEFIQASYRSSAAILGISFISNIYGSSAMGPLMIIGSVPLYNIIAVVVLTVFQPDRTGSMTPELWLKTIKGILTNPIILGIVFGVLWSALALPMPTFFSKFVSGVGAVASPMGLMAMGAMFDIHKAFGKLKPALVAAFIKLFGLEIVFLPAAVLLGFRNEELVAILVMLGSATTVASYVMAKNMGHEGVMTSSTVMLTTMFSAFSLTFWLFLMRSMGFV